MFQEKIEKFNSSIYAKIDRQFLQKDGDMFLTEYELYIFTILALNERKDGVSRLNFYLIEKMLAEKLGRTHSEQNNKIIELLNGLKNKKIIDISHFPKAKNHHEFFYTRINYDGYQKSKEEGWHGFEPIYWSEFMKCKKISHFYLYCIIKLNQGTGMGFKCTFQKWSEISNIPLSTVKRYLNQMIDKNIIFTNRGDYLNNSRTKQDVNVYRTYEFTEDEKTTRSKQYEKEKRNKKLKNIEPVFGELPF